MLSGNVLEDLKKDLTAIEIKTETQGKDLEGSYIFISYDLVNSTAYKSRNPNWPEVFSFFMENCKKGIKTHFSDTLNVREWKRIGDEILFYIPHPLVSDVLHIPECTFRVLQNIIADLPRYNTDSDVQLSVKATLWAAFVRSEKEVTDSKLFNIVTFIGDSPRRILDFLGPDIDTGFRLAKYASPGKLVIDANLAWFFTKYADDPGCNAKKTMKIVAFEELKGVWNGRRYPIIWYHDDWDHIIDSFYYDEEFYSEIIRNIKDNPDKAIQDIDKLQKILSDVNMRKYAEELYNAIIDFSGKKITGITDQSLSFTKNAELHLVAVCINENNEILALKRSAQRSYLPNIWEFGCTYLHFQTDIKESLLIGYKDKLDITLYLEENLLPIASFSLNKEGSEIPGYIYKAKIQKEHITKDNIVKNEKYSEYKWIHWDNLKEIPKTEAVTNFHQIVKQCLNG
jgi:hypothetical protein